MREPLRRIESGGVDSKNFVHKKIRGLAKDLAAWKSQMSARICNIEEDLVQTKLILESVKGRLV